MTHFSLGSLSAWVLLVLVAALPVSANELPIYDASDENAVEVTETNLLASERFWPYHVALVQSWQPPEQPRALRPGTRGVLIRVEASGRARLDFGRDGLFQVPVSKTDLVARANRVRRGELAKLAPNLAVAIGPRLLVSGSGPLRPVGMQRVSQTEGFLSVFADPDAEGFEELAKALASLRPPAGVTVVLFPQGSHSDAALRDRLRSLQWPAAFVYDFLSESYTRSQWGELSGFALQLQSNEGRVLFQSPWQEGVLEKLAAALQASFGGPPVPEAGEHGPVPAS
ncbi:MAG: hypothetical protein MJE66_09895 [Proteobacteria bacterium]|nr:hypothetical protein [Pseudomonadota bacterium]